MKFRNMKISLIALLTGVISLTSLGEVYAGEKIDVSGPGKIARVEYSSVEETKYPEMADSLRARAEKKFTVLKTNDGKTEVVDNETRTGVEIDPGIREVSGTSALIGAGLLRHVSAKKMKKVEVRAEVEPAAAAYFKERGFPGVVDAAGNLEISVKGSKVVDFLNVFCGTTVAPSVIGAEPKVEELGLLNFTARGFDPGSIKELEQAAGDSELKLKLAAIQGFYNTRALHNSRNAR